MTIIKSMFLLSRADVKICVNHENTLLFMLNYTVFSVNISSLTISSSRHTEHGAGEILSIYCLVDIALPPNVPPPTFEWFFGPDNSSLPSGVTVLPVTNNGNTYNSTLHFSPLLIHHTGLYTCRLGSNYRLAASAMITADCSNMIYI